MEGGAAADRTSRREVPVRGGAIACTEAQLLLGEGLRWDAHRGELLGVDILAGHVYRASVADDGDLNLLWYYWVPGTVGAVVPVAGDDSWLIAAGRGIARLSRNGMVRPLLEMSPVGTRMNDGACDPQGRYWVGTLADDHRTGGGGLYRVDPDGHFQLVLDDLTISNGLGWSPDGRTMYLVDSGPRVIHAFAFDAAGGSLSDDRTLVQVDDDTGVPDGLTVDADGDLWVAMYGGGRVERYSPDGVLREVYDVPAEQVTSCAFAGSGLRRLYVITATEGWDEQRRQAERAAGLVYRFDTDATGLPAEPFRPDPAWWAPVAAGPDEG